MKEMTIKHDQEFSSFKNQFEQRNTDLKKENEFLIKNRYQQNTNLYSTMKTEKWAIYALLCLILMIIVI